MITKKVYIAPSGFFAFVDRAHPKHTAAAAFFRYFGIEEYNLYTDMFSVMAAYKEIYDKISPSLGKDFLRALQLSTINLLYPTESDNKAALKALINYRTTDLTYQDALIAVLANRNRITQICTFDYLHPLFGIGNFFLPI